MAKIVVLGGCGTVGRVAVRTLIRQKEVDRIVIADANRRGIDQLINELDSEKASGRQFDASSGEQVREAVDGADIVLNCVGPFYKTVKTILETIIHMRIPYVDICDDVDVTREILAMDASAKAAGVTALIGMGSSPGATNLLAKFAADTLLDETESVDIYHAHGGEPVEGAGVIGHRFHCMQIDIPMYLNGRLETVGFFEPEGRALRQTFDFPLIGNDIELYPYPHPEQVTLPDYIELKQVTNKGTVLPAPYYNLIKDICRLGLADKTPLEVNGQMVSPYDFAIAYILRERERILKETGFQGQRGCCSVIVSGKKDGRPETYRFHMASLREALGEGTGIPAAIGVLLMLQGKVRTNGVLPPEGCVNPSDFIEMVSKVMDLGSTPDEDGAFSGVIVERVDADGNITTLDIA